MPGSFYCGCKRIRLTTAHSWLLTLQMPHVGQHNDHKPVNRSVTWHGTIRKAKQRLKDPLSCVSERHRLMTAGYRGTSTPTAVQLGHKGSEANKGLHCEDSGAPVESSKHGHSVKRENAEA